MESEKMLYVNGEWKKSQNEETYEVINPANEAPIARVQQGTKEDMKEAIDSARDAFDNGPWSRMSPVERSDFMFKLAAMIEQNQEAFGKMETLNTGKPKKQVMEYDIAATIDNIKFFAGASRVESGISANEYLPEGTSILRKEPVGVVGVIVPWNYPLMMVGWRAIPPMLMGNTVVLKPATYTPLTATFLAEMFHKLNFPKASSIW